jgi:hypothetical protein
MIGGLGLINLLEHSTGLLRLFELLLIPLDVLVGVLLLLHDRKILWDRT